MRSFSHQKFNNNFIVAHLGGGENRDFAQINRRLSEVNHKMHLTKSTTPTRMTVPRNIEVGFSSSNSIGDSTPIIKSVFLCLPFLAQSNFGLCNSIMTVLFGRPLRSVVPIDDSANSFNTVTRFLAGLRDGFTTQTIGIHQ